MAEVSYNQVIKDIKSGKFSPVYLFHGEEPFYIDQVANALGENALNESEKDFNFNILYGKDTDIDTIKSVVTKYPMMASRQVVIVKEAQEIKKLDQLLNYVKNPVQTTVLGLCYKHKKLDKRTKFYKALKDNGVIMEAKRVSERKIPQWIEEYLHEKDYGIETKATYLLTEYLGNDLKKITNELDKLLLDEGTNKKINVADIEKNVGISKDYNVFELQSALGKKDVVTTTKIINYYRANPKANPLPMLTVILYGYFSKLFSLIHKEPNTSNQEIAKAVGIPNFVLDEHVKAADRYKGKLDKVFDILQEYDLRSKGINDAGTDEPELMREMIFRILYL